MTEARRIEAAHWVDRLADRASEADHHRFARWSEEPANAQAYAEAARACRIVGDLADRSELQALRRAALARAARRSLKSGVPWPALSLAAAAVALVVGLPVALRSGGKDAPVRIAAAPTYRTAVGQRLEVLLEDGSRVTLDTASRVRVAYTPRERRLILESGQAMFEVAKHRARPFVVAAGGREVVAHGTAFNVRLDPQLVRVALVEGGVTVESRGSGAVAMRPADVLTAGPGGVSIRRDRAAVDALTEWSEGRVVAENEPLSELVAEMNRYAVRPLVLAGDVGGIRVSGSFRTGEVEPFVEMLQLGFPVAVHHRADGAIVLVRRS